MQLRVGGREVLIVDPGPVSRHVAPASGTCERNASARKTISSSASRAYIGWIANSSGASSRDFASRFSLIAIRGSSRVGPVVVQPGRDLHHLPPVRAVEAGVGGQQSLQQRGSAAHHADHHDRRVDRSSSDLGMSADPLLSAQPHPQAVHEARAQDVHADVVEVGGGVAVGQHVQRLLERQRAPIVRGVPFAARPPRVQPRRKGAPQGQNFRWWLVSPTWSTNMMRVSNHQVPSMRWKVSR